MARDGVAEVVEVGLAVSLPPAAEPGLSSSSWMDAPAMPATNRATMLPNRRPWRVAVATDTTSQKAHTRANAPNLAPTVAVVVDALDRSDLAQGRPDLII